MSFLFERLVVRPVLQEGIANPHIQTTHTTFVPFNGSTLYGFDLTPDTAEGAHVDPVRYGNLRLDVRFSAQLPGLMERRVDAVTNVHRGMREKNEKTTKRNRNL